jgi:hypothetical protein
MTARAKRSVINGGHCFVFVTLRGMYIRWLVYQSHALASWKRNAVGNRLTAIVVESVRVDGKPRQRHIASLASIREREMDDVRRRCQFWEQVTHKLDRLDNRVSADDRRRIEAALAERVSCPTRKQYDRFKSEALALIGPKWVKPAVERWPKA